MSGRAPIEISERKLADFLLGASVKFATAKEEAGPRRRSSDITPYLVVDPLEQRFELRALQLVRVCDAYLDGEIDADVVKAVGFLVVDSDAFDFDVDTPDGDRVMDVASNWATPEINIPIDDKSMRSWKACLQGKSKRPVA